MSSSIARINVVGAHHRPGELLGDVVHFVGRLRAGKQTESVPTVGCFVGSKSGRRSIEGFVPGCRAQDTLVAHERRSDPWERRGLQAPVVRSAGLAIRHQVPRHQWWLSEWRTVALSQKYYCVAWHYPAMRNESTSWNRSRLHRSPSSCLFP